MSTGHCPDPLCRHPALNQLPPCQKAERPKAFPIFFGCLIRIHPGFLWLPPRPAPRTDPGWGNKSHGRIRH